MKFLIDESKITELKIVSGDEATRSDMGAVEFTVTEHPFKEGDYQFTTDFQGEKIDYIPDPPFKRMQRLFKKGFERGKGYASFCVPFWKLSKVNQDAVTEQYREQVKLKEVQP